mgnify:FL=1
MTQREDAPYQTFNLAVGEGEAFFSGGFFGEVEARSVTPAGTEVEFSRPGQGFPNRGTFDFLTVYDDTPPASQTPAPFDGSGVADVFGGTEAADIARGFDGDDALSGAAGNDTLEGGAGRDTLEGGPGFDRLAGGPEIDTARFGGAFSDHALTVSLDGITVVDVTGAGGIDRLNGVERLEFGDGFSFGAEGAVDATLLAGMFEGPVEVTAADVTRFVEMYIAYFDRAPDAPGLLYWCERLSEGMLIEQIAASFFDQDESRALYPDPDDNFALVTAAYDNLLERAPLDVNRDYWIEQLELGNVSRAEFMLAIINGAKADTGSEADAQVIAEKGKIGLYYSAVNGLTDPGADAAAVMDLYDRSDAAGSLAEAKALIDDFVDAAYEPGSDAGIVALAGVLDPNFALA